MQDHQTSRESAFDGRRRGPRVASFSMLRRAAGAAAVLLVAVALAGCGDSTTSSSSAAAGKTPDVAACETAMRKQLADAVSEGRSTPTETGTRPAACAGVDDATLERLGEKLLGEILGTETP